LAETVFILTLADFRPIAAKYSDNFLAIITTIYAAVEHLEAANTMLLRY